jgi:hypothetical protein
MKKWTKERYAKELEDVRNKGKNGLGLPNPHPKGQRLVNGKLVDARELYRGRPIALAPVFAR